MRQKRDLTLVVLSVISLFLIAGCAGGSADVPSGAPTTPFLGGTEGLGAEFLEGSPPEEVTDDGTFPFQIIVSLTNKGEFDLKKKDVNVSIIGVDPTDFDVTRGNIEGKGPEDDPTPRQRDSEGNIIEAVQTFITFPQDGKENFDFKGDIENTRFTFRAETCYRYMTDVVSELCVLENMVDVANDAICDPSESKSVFSSGSPIKVDSFRQSVAGKDKIQFSFDIVHVGSGVVFDERTLEDSPDCPSSTTDRRKSENKVNVTVKTGLPNFTNHNPSLKCVGLKGQADSQLVMGSVTLSNGKRTITCTQDLTDRSDFKRIVDINVTFNYLEHMDKVVLVKDIDSS
ncbi:MAG: hypothetical protein QGH47_00940 [Candidatus Woesearchaeota archaeon]|jgi:hypothetical protein|nr:hypothetical protein [Candidatus Woesearchaeota archaeon]